MVYRKKPGSYAGFPSNLQFETFEINSGVNEEFYNLTSLPFAVLIFDWPVQIAAGKKLSKFNPKTGSRMMVSAVISFGLISF